jgi:CRP-like cAMP-binding protein
MIQNKTQKTCEHLEVLSQRTIRDRIYTFFEILSTKTNSRQFEIPFTMSNMADYLSVDRSAMSRELSKMKDEGIIKINKRKVTLL